MCASTDTQFNLIFCWLTLKNGKKYIAQEKFEVKLGTLFISDSRTNPLLLLTKDIGVEPVEHASIPVQLMVGFPQSMGFSRIANKFYVYAGFL